MMFGWGDEETIQASAQIHLPDFEDFERECNRRGGDVRGVLKQMRRDLDDKAPSSVSLDWVRRHWNEWDLEINVEVSGLLLW